jgi:pimeloyl-ACP methyl ester carboxylesterase
MIHQRNVVIGGVRLYFLEREGPVDNAKPPILLLHGLVASAETFASLLQELPDDRRILALNLPGSELPGQVNPADVTLSGLAKLVTDFAAAANLILPLILGHSHGGAIALRIAASFPDAITGLILLCPAHPFLYRERHLIAFYNSTVGRMVARSFRFFPERFQGLGFRRLVGPKGRKAGVDFRPYRASLADPHTVEAVLRLIKTWNADMDALGRSLALKSIQLPVLFLWGDKDPVVPISTGPALQKHLTRWEQFTLPGVGHLPNDEDPAQCGSLICTWLIWLDTGALAQGGPSV